MVKDGTVFPDDRFPHCEECQSPHFPPGSDAAAFDALIESRKRQLLVAFEHGGLLTDPAMVTATAEFLIMQCIAHEIPSRQILKVIIAAGGITGELKMATKVSEGVSASSLARQLHDATH